MKKSLANKIAAKKKEAHPSNEAIASRQAAGEKYENWFSAPP
ncbi:MAG TPA: hypothetical protein VK400_19030 [Pyrinomonadaceae bacterium]|nr:hypothetical protein [Pyrinomonadaceae bacterium]